MNKYVITEGILAENYIKYVSKDKNNILLDIKLGIEHNNKHDLYEYEKIIDNYNISNNNNEKIDVLLSGFHVANYTYNHYILLYNHIINTKILFDFYDLYSDIQIIYPKLCKKFMVNSVLLDLTLYNYNYNSIADYIKNKLISNKKYILKPYKYNNRLQNDRIIINTNNNIIEYIIENQFNCSKWLIQNNIKLLKNDDNINKTINVYTLITIDKDYIIGYIYSIIHGNKNSIIDKTIKNQIYIFIKKLLSCNLYRLILPKFTQKAYELLCLEFYITNKNTIKLNNINTNFNELLKSNKHTNDLLTSLFDIVLYNKIIDNPFELIITKKYNHLNDKLINSLSYYEFIRIENKYDDIIRLKTNIANYKLTFIYNKQFKPLISNIKDNKLIDGKYDDKYTMILLNVMDYKNYNSITNNFIERCNALCKFGNGKTMIEISKNNDIIKDIIETLYKDNIDITPIKIAQYIYKQTKICSYFPVNAVYGFIKYFKAKSLLDISAGWGDRLIASCIANIKYYSADPNTCNAPYYKQIIEMLGNNKKQKIVISGFEDLEIIDEYDLIFSSPPFFELEKYSDDKNQSHLKYTTSESWLNDFLFVVIKKAWKYLKAKGHMCLYMNDYYNLVYCEDMVKFCIENLDSCIYKGVIGFTIHTSLNINDIPSNYWQNKIAKPLWIFYKD